jgi:hypothetical protein
LVIASGIKLPFLGWLNGLLVFELSKYRPEDGRNIARGRTSLKIRH